jgi:putative DNA primase/helicase
VEIDCVAIAEAAQLGPGRKSGAEVLFRCPNHEDTHPSLSINPSKNCFLCGPCGKSGNYWELAAFLGKVSPESKSEVAAWLRGHGLLNGNGDCYPGAERRITKAYPYVDEKGNLLFESVRFEPKDFRQRRPDSNGRWIWNLNGIRRVLYRLPKIATAEKVWIAEGEKDVETLETLGIIATCNPGGAGKWLDDYAAAFKSDQLVVIIPDNDEPGRRHAEQVARSLQGKVARIKILELPGLPEKGDVSEWLLGRDPELAAEELLRLAEAASEWEPETSRIDPEPYIEFAPSFLAVQEPPMQYLLPELLPEAVIALGHGEPRTRKSWGFLEIAIALATGTPAFSMDRFSVPAPACVLYSSQEDSARDVRIRAKAILRGRGINYFPETLAFSVHKGINLESNEWHEALIRDIERYRFRLIILDPIRRYAPSADKGPSEVRQITGFLRHLVVNTGATIAPVHHDVKPTAENRDQRRRGHKASGGDWFAAAECPIAFEQAGDNRTLVIPEDYKFSIDPQPFVFRLETDDPRTPNCARVIGESCNAEDAELLATQQRILQYLAEHQSGVSGNAIATALRKRREAIGSVLDLLRNSGQVDCVGLPGRGKKQTWFLRGTPSEIGGKNDE